MDSSPSTASFNLTGSRLKAQLDASRRPAQTRHVRRVVSSHLTPRRKEQQRERPKTVAETRSSPPKGHNSDPAVVMSSLNESPAKRLSPRHTSLAQGRDSEECAAPTPPPSRSNSTNAVLGRASRAKTSGEKHLNMQPSSESSPQRMTPSKLKLRDSLSPMRTTSMSASARSSPGIHSSDSVDLVKSDDSRLSACPSPPKRTPSKLRLRKSAPAVDLASLGRSPSPKRPAKSPCPAQVYLSPSAAEPKRDNSPSSASQQARKK